jgi:hypothetical protein
MSKDQKQYNVRQEKWKLNQKQIAIHVTSKVIDTKYVQV